MSASGDAVGFLDIGAGKVVCIIATGAVGTMRALGFGEARRERGEGGADYDRLVSSINRAVFDAEQAAGVRRRIESVVFTSSFVGFESRLLSSEIEFRKEKEITEADIEKCARKIDARGALDAEDFEVVHAVGARYVLSGGREEGEALGKSSSSLKMLCHLVAAQRERLDEVRSAMRGCGFEDAVVVSDAYAAGLAVLAEDERRAGCMVLDIGESHMSAGVFLGGNFIYGFAVPYGGGRMTGLISEKTGAPHDEAERAKLACGASPAASTDFSEHVDIAGESVLKADMLGIVRPAARICLGLAAKAARERDIMRFVKKIVLAGGGARMKGIAELAEETLGVVARVGIPHGLAGLGEAHAGPEYAAAIGLAEYRVRKLPQGRPRAGLKKFLARFFRPVL